MLRMGSAHAFVGEFDAVGVANETVQDGAGVGRIADAKSEWRAIWLGNQQSANEAIVTSRVGAEVLRQIAPRRA